MSAFRTRSTPFLSWLSLLLLALLALAGPGAAQEKRALSFTDLMRIRQIRNPSVSPDGRWLALTADPDRGDGEVLVHSTRDGTRWAIPLGSNAAISKDGAFVAARLNPTLEAREGARGEAPRRGMALLATATGEVSSFPEVQDFAFSGDRRWLAYHRFEERPDSGANRQATQGRRRAGTTLVLRTLASGEETELHHVRAFAWHETIPLLAYTVASPENEGDGLYVRDLPAGAEHTVHAEPLGHYAALTWAKEGRSLAFFAGVEDKDGHAGHGAILRWDGSGTTELVGKGDAPQGWVIPAGTSLRWSEGGERLFFGWRPLRADEVEKEAAGAPGAAGAAAPEAAGAPEAAAPDAAAQEGESRPPFNPYDSAAILEGRGVDVWHWMDDRINSQQKIVWNREKDRTYTAVHHLAPGKTVALADPAVPDLTIPEEGGVALARSDVPYRREATWSGGRSDLYLVSLESGERTGVVTGLRASASLSPGGRFVLYWEEENYHLYEVATGALRNLTEGLGVPFANEDHDTPNPPGGYGVGGWLEGDEAVLLYDKFDIWVIPTGGGRPWTLTAGEGRREGRQFRVVRTEREARTIAPRQELLLSSYHDLRKNSGFYRARADRPGVTRLLEEAKRFRFLAKAEAADLFLFTREDYDEFPDLWVARPDFSGARKVTEVNPNLGEFAWGSSELVEWLSLDGEPLQGVVIKPGNYQAGKRYPVLVYYYELYSQRLHEFNEPAVNHRPSFPLYASNGYVVFLPDVRFEVGRPGYSATKAVVPGVQRLIAMGLADPDAIGLHGHSWSGYQTAHVITQTNIFRTAIAGAPVGNMTSAYSGIRWGSGLARQFQYEQGQSRLRGSLWEYREDYIDNSPVFFADRIHTPLLILHGDVDDAVPWYQAIELYLALRRLDKETVFLQYRDEPHHPQKYANKLDWAVKMKEWLDHYLKGEPAPDWIAKGVPYTGR